MGKSCCEVKIFVYILVILLGISSWIDINGLWSELPILVNSLPEKWSLPSYMVVIIQIANIGPLAFSVAKFIFNKQVKEVPVIYVIIFVGAASSLLLAFFWNRTTFIGGVEHSTALFSLNFFLALVDCTSSVVFLPFMFAFKPQYITALFIGEGFSGLLPGLVALGQGASRIQCVNVTEYKNETLKNGTTINITEYVMVPEYQSPLFSIEIFFFFLFGMLVISGIAFTMLNFHPTCKAEQTSPVYEEIITNTHASESKTRSKKYELSHSRSSSPEEPDQTQGGIIESNVQLINALSDTNSSNQNKQNTVLTVGSQQSDQPTQTMTTFVCLLLLTMWINGLTNGVLPSIQSYSVLPYGNSAYHLAVNLGSIANPLACFVTFLYQTQSVVVISLFVVVGSSIAAFCISLAVLSPSPFLAGEDGGSVMVVTAWILVTLLLTYSKVSIAGLLRLRGKTALLWCGIVTQIGSAVGALVMFLLVNIFELFVQGPPCSQT